VRSIAALVLVVSGCGQAAPSSSVAWARWFSFRSIEDLAIAPSGDVVLVGEDTFDAAIPSLGVWPRGPWLSRIDVDGDVRTSWTGFAGAPRAVAAGDEDMYLVEGGVRDPAEPDAPPLGECRIVGMDAKAALRWSAPWDRTDGQSRCPSALALVDGTLVARSGPALVGVSASDGARTWEHADVPSLFPTRLAVLGSDVWLVGVLAVLRVRAADGRLTEIVLPETEWDTRAFAVTAHELVLLQRRGDVLAPELRLAAFDHAGTERWAEPLASGGSIGYDAVLSLDGRFWLAGTERVPTPIGISQASALRMRLQRHSAHGRLELTLLREFAEDGRDAVDRSTCPASDVQLDPVVGSAVDRIAASGDGRLVVAGRQGCRDAFVLALEVPR